MEWNKQEDRSQLKESYQISIRMCNFIILPFTILMIFFAGNIFPLLFGSKYIPASIYISIYFFAFTFVSFGYASIPAFLNGQKQTKTVLCLYLIGLLTGIVSSIFLIPIFQAIGAVLGFLIGNICQILFGNFMIAKKYGKDVIGNLSKNVLFYIISIVGGLILFFGFNLVNELSFFSNFWISLIALGIFCLIYLGFFYFFSGIFKMISEQDLRVFENFFEKLPFIQVNIQIFHKI